MKIKEGGGMDIQKEREAFKAWFKKEYLGIDNLANQGDDGAITRRDYAYVGWQAAKAQAVPEATSVGDELQSWVAVNSFAASDAVGDFPIIDANALAEVIEKLTGASQ